MTAEEDHRSSFVPGLELAGGFFREAVCPILTKYVPRLEYTAALIGCGSEVLRFDTEMSTDHHWGPRVMLFLHPEDFDHRRIAISSLLSAKLPLTFRGYSTNFSAPDPEDGGNQHLCTGIIGQVNHRVEIFTLSGFFEQYLCIDIEKPISAAGWLTLPHQKLRSVCAGRVFHDDLSLAAIRDRFRWYPHDVWLYILASCWSRIGEDEHLMGRAGIVGDEIGSSIIASRLVRDIIRLAFLMERVYPPYAKWFGTAFNELDCAKMLKPILTDVLSAPSWKERDTKLSEAYRQVAEMHNHLGITPVIFCEPSAFWGRPFNVIHGDRFAKALKGAIRDQTVKTIARKRLIGNIDMVSDNTDLLEDTARRHALIPLYD
ncbi:MAG: DUF4037 domain-containing protein [Candidatus Hatepunaea meridiana]|nr:DUF4037 domain-containing protein [Candidatus Hatepunaea meridiana]